MVTRSQLGKRCLTLVLSLGLMMGLVGCGGDRLDPGQPSSRRSNPAPAVTEVAPPAVIQTLNEFLEDYQPQVQILSPSPEQVLASPEVSVRLQVRDLPLGQDEATGLGSHLHLILDNQPYQAVYDPTTPIRFTDLEPGTHTLRVFAARPWHESFKNDGAYAQVTFHVLTKTPYNQPNPDQPLLTYSRPRGTYGAEPILLDFYLSNAPLHVIAREDATDNIHDWKIRCTVNDRSFVFDSWQPIYLSGFQRGQNWVKLELLDETGEVVPNAFNTTVRLIDYQPGGQDGLSQLIRGELSAVAARRIIDPNYEPPAPEPVAEPAAPDVITPAQPPVPTAVEIPGDRLESSTEPTMPEVAAPPSDSLTDEVNLPAEPPTEAIEDDLIDTPETTILAPEASKLPADVAPVPEEQAELTVDNPIESTVETPASTATEAAPGDRELPLLKTAMPSSILEETPAPDEVIAPDPDAASREEIPAFKPENSAVAGDSAAGEDASIAPTSEKTQENSAAATPSDRPTVQQKVRDRLQRLLNRVRPTTTPPASPTPTADAIEATPTVDQDLEELTGPELAPPEADLPPLTTDTDEPADNTAHLIELLAGDESLNPDNLPRSPDGLGELNP